VRFINLNGFVGIGRLQIFEPQAVGFNKPCRQNELAVTTPSLPAVHPAPRLFPIGNLPTGIGFRKVSNSKVDNLKLAGRRPVVGAENRHFS
jgi:hypothetical protein